MLAELVVFYACLPFSEVTVVYSVSGQPACEFSLAPLGVGLASLSETLVVALH